MEILESEDRSHIPECLRNYPGGTCRDYSSVLHNHLLSLGFSSCMVCADHQHHEIEGRELSHCWVEYEGFIVDGTYSQFSEKYPKLYMKERSEWHSMFSELRKRELPVRFLESGLDEFYKAIRSCNGQLN